MTSNANDAPLPLPKSEPASESVPPSPWTEQTSSTFEGKRFSEHYDPCQELANKSIKCIHRNAGNKDLCNDYFQAYRDCKKAWTEARRDAKRKAGTSWF